MKITGFIWLDEIVEKLQKKHNVIVNEVQEVLTNKPKFRFVEKGHYLGENVYFALGQRLDATSLFSLSLKRTNVL